VTDGGTLLLTGATGFLGRRLLSALLEGPRRWGRIELLVRSRHRTPAAQRVADLLRLLGRDPGFVRPLEGDLSRPGLGLSRACRRRLHGSLTAIVHVAAETAIDIPLHVARATNVEGTRRLLDLAAGCTSLERFDHVSWVYAGGSGDPEVPVREDDFDPDRTFFRTDLERAEHEAEALVREQNEVPRAIHRLSFTVADDDPGLRALRAGAELLGTLRRCARPDRRVPRLDLVPAGWAARAVAALANTPESVGRSFHLTAGTDRALPHLPLLHPPLVAALSRRPRLEAWAFHAARALGITAIFRDRDWEWAHRSTPYLRYLRRPGPPFEAAETRTLLGRLGVPRPRL